MADISVSTRGNAYLIDFFTCSTSSINLNPENTSSTLIVFSLLGLHALFAFATFFYSRMYLNMKIKFYLLGLSIFTPLVYLFFNLEFLYTIEIPDISILIASFFLVNLFIKDFKYNYVRQYLNVLTDPFYKDDDPF